MSLTKSQTRTAQILRLSFSQIHRVMCRAVDRGLSRRDPTEKYYYLSNDEKAILKGHNYISVLSDESSGIVIDVAEGRTKASVEELCNKVSTEQREDVKTICTDMWDAFIYGAKKFFPNAMLCHDNFHLVGYLNKAVDKVRRREVKKHEALKNTKYIFLKDQSNYTTKQWAVFNSIDHANYEVSRAWRIKENFRDIQFRQEKADAIQVFGHWRKNAMNAKIKEISDVVEMFDRHVVGIINAIQTGSNNARAERINGAIQELKVIGRGYRNYKSIRRAILFFHGNMDLLPHKNL